MKIKMFLSSVLMVSFLVVGCGNSGMEPRPETGVAGNVSLQPGVSGDPSNARVAVYPTIDAFRNDAFIAQAALGGVAPTFTFKISPLNPGSYYLDVWKDLNNNGRIDGGDLYGYFSSGTTGDPGPIQVLDEQLAAVNFEIGLGSSATLSKVASNN